MDKFEVQTGREERARMVYEVRRKVPVCLSLCLSYLGSTPSMMLDSIHICVPYNTVQYLPYIVFRFVLCLFSSPSFFDSCVGLSLKVGFTGNGSR